MTAPVATTSAAADAVAQVARYAAATQLLRTRLIAMLLAAWDGLGGTRDAQVQPFLDAVVPAVRGGQQAMAALTAAYLAQQDATMRGAPLRSTAPDPALINQLRGDTPTSVVYRRPFVQVWTDLANGKPYDQAVTSGRRRLQSLAATDLQLAKTNQSRATISELGDVVGYRRVLVGSHSCGLCVVASTQRYHKSQLMPIHPSCDCAISIIHGHEDPGRTIDSAILTGNNAPKGVTKHGVEMVHEGDLQSMGSLLNPVHQAIEDAFGMSDRGGRLLDYRKVLVTHEHGELGPVLAFADHAFTGPGDI